MKITRTSVATGETHTMDLPVTEEQMKLYESPNRPLIQDIFPDLTNAQREFLINGTTEAEWNEIMKDDEDDDEGDEVLPADHPSNRLGELVIDHSQGQVYFRDCGEWPDQWYAWPPDQRRGYRFPTQDEAVKFLGIKKPTGCSDFEGKQRLGKMIERTPDGEIWKVGGVIRADYYYWENGADEAVFCTSLTEARGRANIS